MKRLAPYLVCLALNAALHGEGRAAQVYWDVDGPTAGAGGGSSPNGIWSTTDSNWNSVSDGTGATAGWVAGDLATFAAGLGATGLYSVVVTGNQSVSGLQLEEGNLVLAGGTLTSTASPLAIQVAAGTQLTLHSILAGTTGMTISGAGTVRLSAPSNTFTGNITVDGTTLAYISSTTDLLSLGAGAKSITLTNGAVLAPSNTSNPAGSTKSVVIGTGGARFHVVNGVSLSLDDANQFSGTGNLTVTGSGTGLVILRNSGTYTGSVNVQSGTLRVSSTAALGATGGGKTLSVQNGATLDIIIANFAAIPISVQGAGVNNLGAITNSSTAAGSTAAAITLLADTSIGVNNTAALTLSGVISGTGMSLTKVGTGSGSLVLSGANTYTGNTVVNGGTLVASAVTTQTPIQSSSGLVMTGTGTFQYLGRSAATVSMALNGLALQGGSATVDVNNNSGTSTTLDLRGTSGLLGISRATSGGTIDFRATSGTFGTDALVKTAQANDASGILGAWATIGGGTGYASNDGTGQIIAYSGSTDIASSGAPIVNGPLTNVRFASGVGATVSLDTGSVTTINTLAQNATTAVTVDTTSKTLRLGAVGGILVTSNAGTTGTLTIGSAANVGTLTAGGTDNAPGELVLSNYSGAALTVNSVIADNGAGAVSVSRSGTGAGAVSLAGTNTYTGVTALHSGVTTVSVLANINTASSIGRGSAAGSAADLVLNGGTLQYTGATAASTDRLFSVGLGGGTLDSSSATAATVSFTGTGAMGFNGQAGARNLTLTGTNTGVNILASVIGDNGGPTTLTKSGAGLWVLTGDNTYTGMTTITAGTLRVGNGGTTGSLGTGAVNLAGVLAFNRSDNYTVNNSIFGNASSTINQASANVLSLAGVGNNTGGLRFTVDGGTIDIMGNDMILTGTSALTTTNNGTINATGGGRILLGVANADYGAASNKTLVINAVIADGTFTTIDFHGGTNSSGITTLTADNIFTGTANIQGQAVSVSKIGNAGAAGNLGLNGVINLGTTTQTTSRLLYTGAGETTNRVINLASTTGAAIIDQSGSGVLEFTSDFTAVAGSKFLTLQGSTSGSGRISGAIVNGSGTVGIIKSGTGLWTLAGANVYTGTTTVNAGVLAAGSTSAFGSNSAVTVNVNGTLRLGGFSNTVGSITGAGLLENGGAANAVLTVGGDGATTTFSGVVRNGGTGTLGINKTGAGTLTLSASEISYTGSTGVAAGTLLITGGQGGFATTGVNVAGGASLLLYNQQGQYLDLGSGPLNLGAGAGTTTLGLELGAGTLTSDGFKTSGAAVVANQVVLSLVGLQGFGTSSFYDVLTAGSGLNTATYSLSAYVPGGYTYGLDVTSTRVRVNLAAMAAGNLYWKGGVVGGALNSWSALVGGQSNWTTDAAGAVNANGTPGAQHSVIFSATTAAGPAISTTLDNNVAIQDLTFAPSPNGVTSVTVAPGSQPFFTLTLSPMNAASGIDVQINAGSVSITAPVVLGASQTWQVAGTGTNGSSLAVTGGISGNAGITKTGTGMLTLGTATYTGDTVISAGTVVAGAASSFSAASAHTLGAGTILRLNGFSGNIGSLSGSGTVENNHASTAVVLTAGANNQSTTFSGVLRNGGVGTLGLTKTGNGTLTLTGLNTYTGPTVVNRGTLLVGTGGSLTGAGALSVVAEAGTAAVFNVNGAALTFSSISLGGASSTSSASIQDTAGTGVVTLTGNLTYAATGDPLGAVVNAVLAYNGTTTGSRTITAASSLGADVELTFNKTITATAFASDQRLVFGGTGDITLNAATSVAGSGSDLQKNGTGILNINAETEAADDWVIDAGITNANVSNALNAADDIVIDGTGVQDSAVVNIGGTAGVSGIHQGDDIFIRNGGRINVTVNNGINTGTDYLLVGDTLSASTAAAARLHLAADISTGAAGLQVGGASGNIGNITGNGSITSAGSFSLRNGSVAAGITLAGTGSITKVTNGTLVFSGESTAIGTTNVQEGTLVLDYTVNNGSKIGGALVLGAVQPNLSSGGPTLVINGNAGAATLQTATGTSILLGASHVEINAAAGREATFSLGALTRTTGGGTVDFVYSDINAVATAAPGSAVLGWATVRIGSGPVRMAAVNSSGRIEQVATVAKASLATWNAEDHILVTGGLSGSVGVTSRAVSTLNFAAASATTVTVEANRQFTIGSGGILVDAGVGANKSLISGGQLAGSLSGVLNELIVHQHNVAGDFEIASRLFNLSTITKSGAGTLVLSANNFFSSSLSNATASASSLVLNEGRVVLRGGNALGDTTSVAMKQGTTLVLEANSVETIGRLGVDGTNQSAGTISLGTGSALTINQTGSATFAGVFEGSGTLNKTGTGNLQLTGNITTGFTGVVNVNAGMLYISGSSARLSGVTAFNLNAGTSFLIDNDDDNSNLTRLADDSVFTLNSANGAWSGETRPRGLSVRTDNSSTTSFVETIGSLVLASGANYATLEASGGTSSVAGIIAANAITRTAGTTFNIRGAGLGAVSGQRTVLKIADASDAAFMAANLVGGGAATGGSNKNISIVPWAIGETIADDLVDANMGNSFVTYVDNRGFVVLDLSTEFRTLAAGGTSQDNIREVLSANLTGLVGPTINSLILHDSTTAAGSLVVSGTGTLTNTSGAFLFTLNPAATASSLHSVKVEGFSAIRVGASSEYIMHVVNPTSTTTTPVLAVEIASNLDTVAASLSKSGRGTLILSGTNTYGGGTYLNEGVVQIKNLGNLGTGGLTFNGGTLQLAASFAGELGSRSIVVSNAGGTLDTNGQNYVWENGLDMTGTGSFAKGGGGLLTVQGASSFGGTFIVNHHSATTGALAGVSQGVLLNGTTNLTVNGNLQIGSSGTPSSGIAGAALGGDEQILDTASITFNGLASSSRWAYFKLLGHTETVAGISDVTGAGVLENRESDVVTSAGTLVLNSSSDFSYNGYLRDNAANSVDANPLNLVKQGSGMQVLSGNQIRYTGTTMVSGGTLYLLNTNLFASAVVNNATVVFDYSPATALTLTKSLSGTGTYVKRGTGTVALNGSNTFSGALVVEDGAVSFSNSLGDNSVGNTITILENATLTSTGGNVVLGNNQRVTLGGTVANVEVVAGGALTLQAGLFGGAQTRFEKEGAGALVLAAAGTFAGEVRINAGKLELRTTAALSSAARATVADGGVLVFNAAAAGAAGDHSFQGSGNVLSLGTSGSGAVNLGFGISGTTNDRLVLGTGQSFTVNATSVLTDIYVAGTPLLNSYTLVQSASGADFGDFTLGTIFNPGAFIYTLDTTQGNALVLNLTAAAVSEPLQAYWKGDLGGNGAGVWAAAEVGGNTNWATAADGLVDTQTTPGALTDVFFNAAGAANFTTSLGADLSVKSVTFLSGSGSGGSATVVTGGNTLTLGTGGFSLLAGSGSISFSPAIRLGASQTWSVADAAAIFTVSGPVSGSGDLTKTGAGTVVFSGVHARTGKTVIEAGAIQIIDETGLGANPAGGFVADQLTLNGGTLITTATMLLDDANRGITLGANGGTFSVNSGTTLTVASALAGSGGLTKSGAGTLVFNTGNTFARATVTTGTMNLAGLTNTITGSLQVGTLATGTLNYAVAGGSLSVGSGSASTLEVGIINDATTAARVGTLDLRGSANFTANVGLLRVGAFVSGANVGMEGDMYLATNNTITAATSFIVANSSSAGVSGTNTVAFGSGISTVNTPVFTIGGLKGSGEATIATGGTLTVQGIGAGTTALSVGRNAGNTGTITTSLFNMTGGIFIGNLGAVIVGEKSGGGAGNATATMTLGSSVDNNVTATSLTVGSYASGTSTTSASFATGTLNMGGGAFRVTGNVVVAGHNDGVGTSTGSLNLTGGTFTVEGSISKGASASSTATITLNGGTLDMTNGAIGTGGANEQINFMAQQGTLRNVAQLNGGSALTKTTAGTLIVSGTNTYTGATTVQAGVLQVGEAHAGSITSATTVQAGATLAGTGTVSNQVNVLNDSFLKPGDAGGAGKGRLTVGTLSVEQGGQMQLQLSAATVPQSGSIVSAITGPGWVDAQTYFTSNAPAWEVAASPLTSHDAITVNGTLTLGTREAGTYGSGTILLVNDGYLSALGDVFNLLDWVGIIQGGFNVSSGVFAGSTSVGDLDLPALQAGHSWDTSAFMTQGILVVVPEPSRVLLLLLAATSITLRRRRSK